MSEELIKRLEEAAQWDDSPKEIIREAIARIEELEQKLRTTSLEALAISDTNNEMAVRIAQLEKECDAAIEAEDEAKDCFWAVYPTYCKVIGAGISTEAARTRLAVRAELAEAHLSEAVKVLEEIDRLSMVIENGVKFAESHHPNIKAVMFAMSKAKSFITTLGGEK